MHVFLSIFKDAECKMTKKKIKKQVVEFPVLAIKMYLYHHKDSSRHEIRRAENFSSRTKNGVLF